MSKRILIIDDERDATDLTSTFLQFHQLDVDSINDPRNIESTIQSNSYDLFIVDLMMPHLDGFQTISLIKSQSKYKGTPIIVITAKSLTDKERKFLYQNNVELITKPYEPLNLVEKISNKLTGVELW